MYNIYSRKYGWKPLLFWFQNNKGFYAEMDNDE